MSASIRTPNGSRTRALRSLLKLSVDRPLRNLTATEAEAKLRSGSKSARERGVMADELLTGVSVDLSGGLAWVLKALIPS